MARGGAKCTGYGKGPCAAGAWPYRFAFSAWRLARGWFEKTAYKICYAVPGPAAGLFAIDNGAGLWPNSCDNGAGQSRFRARRIDFAGCKYISSMKRGVFGQQI